jgi:hypothetical protein
VQHKYKEKHVYCSNLNIDVKVLIKNELQSFLGMGIFLLNPVHFPALEHKLVAVNPQKKQKK